ncbi:hypothetical protein LMG28140_01829 [Paraburkholderia metrosideri]|jgi:hypothetical protein|uniref:Uncharacterized protein n=1 Tax=Paraburkholderia metrosideri TaxID=580937 RepID=A0ABM8NHT4_9BURK|nr:hypothetical protein LMG28140_01829 [Paraburkholderia metrosideri]
MFIDSIAGILLTKNLGPANRTGPCDCDLTLCLSHCNWIRLRDITQPGQPD